MKITIDGKVCNVSFWSFYKGYLLSWLFSVVMIFFVLWIIGVFVLK